MRFQDKNINKTESRNMSYLYFLKRMNSPAREAFFSLRGPVPYPNRADRRVLLIYLQFLHTPLNILRKILLVTLTFSCRFNILKVHHYTNANSFLPIIFSLSVNQQLAEITDFFRNYPNKLLIMAGEVYRHFSDYYKKKGFYVNFHKKQHGIYPPQHR